MALIDDAGRYNRAAIAREAHRAYRMRRDKGMTYSDALRHAWGRAKQARDRRLAELRAFAQLQWAA